MLAVDQRGDVVGRGGRLVLVTDRQAVLAIRFQDIAALDPLNLQRAIRERFGERVSEDREDQLLAPVDVEVACKFAVFAVR